MRNALTHRITRSRRRWWLAAVIVVASGVALSASVAQGRAEPVSTSTAVAAMSPDTVAIIPEATFLRPSKPTSQVMVTAEAAKHSEVQAPYRFSARPVS